MPELPEVETIARKLAVQVQGRTITDVDVLWQRTVDRPSVAAFRDALTDTSVDRVWRRGKFLVMDLNTDQSLLVHLRMTGRFSIQPTRPDRHAGEDVHRHARLRLQLDNEDWLVYVDPRKFGRFYLVADPQELVGKLGPEPLDPAFTAQTLHADLARRRGEIKRLLLNQHFIAGLGNIYVSEALWQAGIHPRRSAGSLSETRHTGCITPYGTCSRRASGTVAPVLRIVNMSTRTAAPVATRTISTSTTAQEKRAHAVGTCWSVSCRDSEAPICVRSASRALIVNSVESQ